MSVSILITSYSNKANCSLLDSILLINNHNVLVSDQGSKDGTVERFRKMGARVYHDPDINLGRRKQRLVEKAKTDWILILDSDEYPSEELIKEINTITCSGSPGLTQGDKRRGSSRRSFLGNKHSLNDGIVGYRIPYQNYIFGRPVYFGGEKYSKVRLFRRGFGRVSEDALHENVIVNGNIGELKGVIHHHSYRSPRQLFSKFTKYAWIAAGMLVERGEKISAKKLFFYGPHMLWARFIKDQGYRDGWRGLVLALAFAYMEGLTYWILLYRSIRVRQI